MSSPDGKYRTAFGALSAPAQERVFFCIKPVLTRLHVKRLFYPSAARTVFLLQAVLTDTPISSIISTPALPGRIRVRACPNKMFPLSTFRPARRRPDESGYESYSAVTCPSDTAAMARRSPPAGPALDSMKYRHPHGYKSCRSPDDDIPKP